MMYSKKTLILLLLMVSLSPLWGAKKDTLTFKNPQFSENKGQWLKQVLFRAKISNGNLWLEKNQLTFDIQNAEDLKALAEYKANFGRNKKAGKKFPATVRRHIYKMQFVGSNTDVQVQGYAVLPDYENYFLGKDSSKWASRVRKYRYVVYHKLYPHIDYKIYGYEGFLKWDFIVKPGGKPGDIKINYRFVDKVNISPSGYLTIKTLAGKIIELAPYAYQYRPDGTKQRIDCRFRLKGKLLRFDLASYDPSKKLIIDPTLVYASYSGSTADNWGYTATYDYNGFVFGGGSIFGSGHYPTTNGAIDTIFSGGSCDIGITKYDPNSSNLIYSTYIGGSGSEVPSSLVVNSADELYILSTTGSNDFPVSANAYDTSFNGGSNITLTYIIYYPNGSDICLTKLNSSGTQILGSTYFGGSGNDGMNAATNLDVNYADKIRGEVLVDKNHNCYVVSSTTSSNLPTSPAVFQPAKSGLQDAFILKMDNNLTNKIWCSYLGGNFNDAGYSIGLTSNDMPVVSGGTNSTNLPASPGALMGSYQGGQADGFVAKISKNGNSIQSLSYFGTARYDQSFFVDLDRNDNVYLYGQTSDTGSALIYNALWNHPGGGQFVSKLKPDLSGMLWSTEWGSSQASGPDISPSAFMVDLCNRVYMSGWGGNTNYFGTTNGLPITSNAFQHTTDGSDYYFLVLKDDASAMDYATFYGGSQSHEHVDGGTSRFDNRGKLYQSVCAGCGGHSDFPTTTGCHSSTNNSSNCNNAVIKFDFLVPVVVADFISPPVGCAPYATQFVSTSYITSPSATCFWDFGNGDTSHQCNPQYTYTQGGIYQVSLIITDSASCNIADTLTRQVAVIEGKRDTLPGISICKGDFTQIGVLPINDPNVSYQWDHAALLSNVSVSNPIAHPIQSTWFTLLFSNGTCTDTLMQLVKVYDVHADAGNDTTLCFGNITLKASSNYPGMSFQWSSSPAFNDTLNSTLSDSSLTTTVSGPTYFYLRVSSPLGCSDIDSIRVEPRITLNNLQINNPLCHGDTNGSISVSAGGGTTPYTYQWSSGGSTQASLTNLSGGSYSLTVSDADGCYAIGNFQLIDPPLLQSQHAAKNIPCPAACIGQAIANPSGGTPPYTWQWDDPSNQTQNPASNLCEGTYHVTITDANNCITYDTVSIIDSSVYITLQVYADKDTAYEGQSIQLHANYLGTAYQYSWTPAGALSNPFTYNPYFTANTTTTFYLTVSDIYGCSWLDSLTVYVIDVHCDEPYIYVPNAFTPDGDGHNDIIYVRASVGYEMDFMIFNRWGEKVFESHDINHGWDGTYKGEKLEPAVFDYYLRFTCFNKEVFEKKGNITLIR